MGRTLTLIDTGPLVALLDARDQRHQWSKETLGAFKAPFFTCESVISESHFLLRARTHDGNRRLNGLLERDKIQVRFPFPDHRVVVLELMARYNDAPMSFADACLVRMAGITPSTIVTLDRGFERFRTSDGRRLSIIAP